jgi:hypothetical protein
MGLTGRTEALIVKPVVFSILFRQFVRPNCDIIRRDFLIMHFKI